MKQWVTPLPERLAGTAPAINATSPGDYLERAIRRNLRAAMNEGKVAFTAGGIPKHVRLDPESKLMRGAFDLVGGRRNFQRTRHLADLLTPDGGWLFFAAILRPTKEGIEVVAYNVERFFGNDHHPNWIRFDYNEPGHDNDDRGLRSHFHPGNDDIQLPAPIFAPHELIDLLLGDLGPRRDRKPRAKGLGDAA